MTKEHPFQCQIHRDSSRYGELPASVDDRLIVDLRWFSSTEPSEHNTITFEEDVKDLYGLPQPTFLFKMSEKDADQAHKMVLDMTTIAVELGGFLPGSEPRFMPLGSSLHLTVSTFFLCTLIISLYINSLCVHSLCPYILSRSHFLWI